MTDRDRFAVASVAVGFAAWVAFATLAAAGTVQRLLALALLVVVPLCLATVETTTHPAACLHRVATALQLPAALAVTVALALDPGLVAATLAVPWFAFTALVACVGLARVLPRGLRPVEEVVVDAGLAYVVVGGTALVVDRAGVGVLGFEGVLVVLAAIHFHYAGLVLPLLTGLAGRVAGDRGAYAPVAAVVLAGPGLIGLGITFSATVEVVAVTAFTVGVTAFGAFVLVAVVPGLDGWRRRLPVAASAVVLPASMAMALGFAVGRFLGQPVLGLDVATMAALHGRLNALGFALLGAVGWWLVRPRPRHDWSVPPLCSLAAGRRVGADYFERAGAVADRSVSGQVESFDAYARDGFDPGRVHPSVRRFYEETEDYALDYRVRWHSGFRWLGAVSNPITARLEQLNLPGPNADAGTTRSAVVPVAAAADGRSDVRGWVRTDDADGAVFVAAYATHGDGEATYMNIGLPLPGSTLAAVLRPDHGDRPGSVRLTSRRATPSSHEGLYLVTPLLPVRLPVHETFDVWADDGDCDLRARHEMSVLGRRFLTIAYEIHRSDDG